MQLLTEFREDLQNLDTKKDSCRRIPPALPPEKVSGSSKAVTDNQCRACSDDTSKLKQYWKPLSENFQVAHESL